MLACDRIGTGPAVVLLHGTNGDRRHWAPLVPRLAGQRTVYAVDLPAHGASPPSSFDPPGFARDVARFLDAHGLERPVLVGNSIGGWVALELAARGRAAAVVALAPAGLWRRRSPLTTDAALVVGWTLGRLAPGGLGARVVRHPLGRALALRQVSARPRDLDPRLAADVVVAARAARHFPRHFRETRVQRFDDGAAIPDDVPVLVVWGDADPIAHRRRSRFPDALPAHARVETWRDCGHAVMWDRPADVAREVLSLSG